jgi:acyl-CoA synthetase (AMP-forming)/AMP-acid ligase II
MDFLVHHMLRSSAERAPEKEAIVCGDERLNYRETWARVCALASGLRGLGMERGDRVGIYMEPSVAQALSILAVCRAGGVFVPINEVLFPDQVAHIANDCRMRGLITSEGRLERVKDTLASTETIEFIVAGSEDVPTDLGVEARRFGDLIEERVSSDWKDWSIEKDLAALYEYDNALLENGHAVRMNPSSQENWIP